MINDKNKETIFLNIQPKFFDFDEKFSTGNFKIKVLQYIEVIENKKQDLLFQDTKEDNYGLDVKLIDIEEIVPAYQLKTYVREFELKYKILDKLEDEVIDELVLNYINITSKMIKELIPDDFILNFGKYKNIKVKDIITKKKNVFRLVI